jgi:hypothetical protein
MAIKRLRSRLHSHFTEAALMDLNRLCMDRTISNNNQKADMILSILDKHGIDYVELGPGTNRLAILIDNYVYKIALDIQGKRDNINEFKISQELQPYVVKTYETNELISVHEYITVISREEFVDQVEDIRRILAILAETYLLGDVGTKEKNFCNWGFRDDGKLVILDFAHIYRIDPDQIVCQSDQTVLEYDRDYHDMICPKCGRKYQFMAVRRLISLEQEEQENIITKRLSHKLTTPIEEFEDDKPGSGYTGSSFTELPSRYNIQSNEEESEEENTMSRGEEDVYDKDTQEDSYNNALERMVRLKTGVTDVIVTKQEEQVVQDGDTVVTSSVSETNVDTLDERSQVRVYRQTTEITTDARSVEAREAMEEVSHQDEEEIQAKALEELQALKRTSADEVSGNPADIEPNGQPATIIVADAVIIENEDHPTAKEPGAVTVEGNVADDTKPVFVGENDHSSQGHPEVGTTEVPAESNVPEESKERPPLVTVIRTEERVIVDGEVVDQHESVRIENEDDESEEASSLAAELLSGNDATDPDADNYEELHDQAEHDRIQSSTRNRRGGKNQWE